MANNRQPESDLSPWQFTSRKRWKISVTLETVTPLHIGSGESFTITIGDGRDASKDVEVSGCIKDFGNDQGGKTDYPRLHPERKTARVSNRKGG